jgi:hypothetical protein
MRSLPTRPRRAESGKGDKAVRILNLLYGMAFAVVVCAVLLLVLGVSFHRPAPAQGAALYNPAAESLVRGVVQEELDFDCPVSEGEMGRHLMLKTSEGVLQVHLAPARIMSSHGFSFVRGDQIEVRGALVRLAGTNGIIAREITRGNETIIFRDGQGKLLLVQ